MQRIVLRNDYGIHADTKLISHYSAFSLASILLTSDRRRVQIVSTNFELALSSFHLHFTAINVVGMKLLWENSVGKFRRDL